MKVNATLMAALLVVLTTGLLHAQSETPPECLNLDDVQQKIGYPIAAKTAGVEGKVIAKVVVDEKGKVEDHEIVESPSELLSAAVEKHLKNLKFHPARKDGNPIKSIVHVPFAFVLPEGDVSFTSLEDALESEREVLELDLSGQKLNNLDPRIVQLKSLRILKLDDNAFVKFPREVLKLKGLQELHLSDNLLERVPGGLKKLKSLVYLDLSSNKLSRKDIDKVREMFEEAQVMTD